MKAKQKSQKQHAQKRALQRYGLTVGPRTYSDLCKKVQECNGDCVFLEKQSNRVSFFAVKLENKWVPIIYDKHRHTVVTFLPEEVLEPHRDKLNGAA